MAILIQALDNFKAGDIITEDGGRKENYVGWDKDGNPLPPINIFTVGEACSLGDVLRVDEKTGEMVRAGADKFTNPELNKELIKLNQTKYCIQDQV